jgi:endonuclease IV
VRIGAHVSVAGGLDRAVGNALAAGCESLQVFVSNARGWAPPQVDPPADRRFRADLAEAGLGPLFVHAPYLVLELTAGTRGALAARFDEMAELLAACGHHPRLKVCMDTCHAQSAGYDLGDPAGAAKALGELFATLGDRVVLVTRFPCRYLPGPFGSGGRSARQAPRQATGSDRGGPSAATLQGRLDLDALEPTVPDRSPQVVTPNQH